MTFASASASRAVRRFFRRESGSLTIIFAILAPAALLCAAILIDYFHTQNTRRNMQDTLDGATLAAAAYLVAQGVYAKDMPPAAAIAAQARKEAKRVAKINGYEGATLTIGFTDNGVTGALSAPFTPYLGVFHDFAETLRVTSSSRTPDVAEIGAEIVLGLDVSSSMYGDKTTRMKAAAKDLIARVIGEEDTREGFYFALAPFNSTLSLPSSYANAWIAPRTEADLPNAPANASSQSYDCPGFRAGQARHDDTTISASRLAPYPVSKIRVLGITWVCNTNSRILPLTAKKSEIFAKINAMRSGGATGSHTAMTWAWRLISPRWRSSTISAGWGLTTLPLDYGLETSKKYVILMTDGVNASLNVTGDDLLPGNQTNDSLAAESYRVLKQTCEKMKTLGIVIFTVVYDLNNATVENHLKTCASSAQHYRKASEHGLGESFAAIAEIIRKEAYIYLNQ